MNRNPGKNKNDTIVEGDMCAFPSKFDKSPETPDLDAVENIVYSQICPIECKIEYSKELWQSTGEKS